MKALIALFALFASTCSQIIRTTTQTDTTSLTNSIKPFTDIFTCPCDYIANSCDIYCCCDTECLDSTITSWTDLDLCTSWEDTGSLFQKCPDESLLESLVNPSTQETVGIQQFSTIFCIDYEMVPYAGYFFVENNGTTTGTVLIHGSTTTTTSDTAYSSEQNLYSKLSGSSTVLSRFTIPKADPFGMCENTFSARYLVDLSASSCTRQVTLSTDCSASSVLSTTYYTTTLISAYPAETTSSITITQGNIIRTNGAAPGTSTIAYTDLTTSCRCDNAVAAVEYYVTYSTDNKITAVRADFTLQSIVSTDCSVTTALDQSFAVYYQTVSGTTAAIPRSGNPGYIVGLPLLVGYNQTTYINRLIGGFRIRGISTTGECTTPSADYTAYREDTIPKFGMNSSLTCYLTVPDTTTLSTYCKASYISTNIMLFQNFGTDKSVGLFGSSDIKYISDWIQIEQPTTALSSYPVELSGTSCSLPDEEIYIFYAEYGLSSNPQNYIVKVARRYNINRTFKFASSATTNYLQFTQTIKYIKISSEDLLTQSSS